MMVLGIVLIVLAVLLGLGVSVSSGDSTTMSVFGVDFGVIVPTVFFIGAAAGAALMIGLWLTKKGLARGYRRHKEVKELRQKVAATPDQQLASAPDEQGTSTPDERLADSPDQPVGKHAAPASELDADPDSRTVDLEAGDRLAAEQHTVADGTDTRQPH
jgi:hypothetical protein